MKYVYYNNCVNWNSRDVDGLSVMIDDAIDITRKTFLKHVDKTELKRIENDLGYENHHKQGLVMASDYAVAYYRSKLHGKTVYYFTHSCIEYVFVQEN